MKPELIRTVSPLTLIVAAVFDLAAVFLTVLAVRAVIIRPGMISVLFLIIMLIDLGGAVLAGLRMMKTGVMLYEDRAEFTGVDTENVYYYEEIERIETYKDTKANPKKRYTDRYSSLILTLKNGEVATVELGSTTKKKLAEIETKLNQKIKGE